MSAPIGVGRIRLVWVVFGLLGRVVAAGIAAVIVVTITIRYVITGIIFNITWSISCTLGILRVITGSCSTVRA